MRLALKSETIQIGLKPLLLLTESGRLPLKRESLSRKLVTESETRLIFGSFRVIAAACTRALSHLTCGCRRQCAFPKEGPWLASDYGSEGWEFESSRARHNPMKTKTGQESLHFPLFPDSFRVRVPDAFREPG